MTTPALRCKKLKQCMRLPCIFFFLLHEPNEQLVVPQHSTFELEDLPTYMNDPSKENVLLRVVTSSPVLITYDSFNPLTPCQLFSDLYEQRYLYLCSRSPVTIHIAAEEPKCNSPALTLGFRDTHLGCRGKRDHRFVVKYISCSCSIV